MYSVIEKVKIKDQSGLHLGDAQRKYIGDEFKGFIDELNRLAKSGNLPTDKSIVINLTINVNSNNITQGDNGVVTNGNNRVTNIVINTSKELRAALQKL